jgi:hypothetical protein
MLIDHLAAGLVLPSVISGDMYDFLSRFVIDVTLDLEIQIYVFLRGVGRQAFPIFCYLLVEGFMHTHSKARYSITLAAFALISEIPFDLGLITYKAYDTLNLNTIYTEYETQIWESQNVYFTLALGVIAMWAADSILKKLKGINIVLAYAASIIPFGLAAWLAYYMKTDYNACGIAVIAILYYSHSICILATLLAYIFLTFTMSTPINGGMEEWSLPAFMIINLYNGQRGFIKKNFKYFFYWFYPAHLIILYFMNIFIFNPNHNYIETMSNTLDYITNSFSNII